MGTAEVAAFRTHLAVERNVAPATQSQARSALLFLYRVVLDVQLSWLDEVVAAKDKRRLPVVLTPTEVKSLLHELNDAMGLVAALLYGTGMRLLEGLRLRVKDVDFERCELIVRNGKGGKDRVTVLPENLIPPLQQQMAQAKGRHDRDLAQGLGEVWSARRGDPAARPRVTRSAQREHIGLEPLRGVRLNRQVRGPAENPGRHRHDN